MALLRLNKQLGNRYVDIHKHMYPLDLTLLRACMCVCDNRWT